MSTYRCEACGFTAEGSPTMVRLETGRYHFFVRHEGCGGRMERVPCEPQPVARDAVRELALQFEPVCWATLYDGADPIEERCWHKPGHEGMHHDKHQGWTDSHPDHRPGPPGGHVYSNRLGANE